MSIKLIKSMVSLNRRKILALAAITILIFLLYKANIFYYAYRIVRIVLGLALVLFIPGYISTFVFFKKEEMDFLERIAMSVGLSISFVVLTVMFSNLYLNIPINLYTILAQIAFICLFFAFAKPVKNAFALLFNRAVMPLINRLNLTGKQKYIIAASFIIGSLLVVDMLYPVIFMDKKDAGEIEFSQLYSKDKISAVHYIYSERNIDRNIAYEEITQKRAN
ncbi:MAG: hypothetical protein DRN66_01210, partial [Candidatus Nanohalarchaeota archaeon]